jgi:hypothetical protein
MKGRRYNLKNIAKPFRRLHSSATGGVNSSIDFTLVDAPAQGLTPAQKHPHKSIHILNLLMGIPSIKKHRINILIWYIQEFERKLKNIVIAELKMIEFVLLETWNRSW